MIKAKYGDRLDGWLEAALPFLFTRPIDPNLLTVVGTVISLGAAIAFATGDFRWAGALILLGGSFDLVDGVVARHHGTATLYGAFLDSTLDRLVDMALLLGVLVRYASEANVGIVLLAGWALVASVLVSYAKARAELHVEVLEGGLLERGERVGLLAAGAILGVMPAALWVIAIGATITVVQRMRLARRALDEVDAVAAAERGKMGEPSQ